MSLTIEICRKWLNEERWSMEDASSLSNGIDPAERINEEQSNSSDDDLIYYTSKCLFETHGAEITHKS